MQTIHPRQALRQAPPPPYHPCLHTPSHHRHRLLPPSPYPNTHKLNPRSNLTKCKAGQWLENSATQDVPVPIDLAWALWEDRELIPQWMPWIKTVKVQNDDPQLSKWTLSTNQFGRDWEFSWFALNMTPLRNQKIHWRSVPGSTGGSLGSSIEVANRGQIRFSKKGPELCTVKLTISYEVPSVLAPFANLLTPLVEGILKTDMERFSKYAQEEQQRR